MKRPDRRRKRMKPGKRQIDPVPPTIDLAEVAKQVKFVGSVTHKGSPSFAGKAPSPRPDASLCPRDLANCQQLCQTWLEQAIRDRHAGAWRGPFPRYVFFRDRDRDVVFVAQELTQGSGRYKGYPLAKDEIVRGLP